MKKLFIAAMLCLSPIVGHLQAQSVTLTEEQYKSLPEDVRREIDRQNTLNTVSEWAGLGKEIGEGVNGALTAIEGSAARISETNIGKTAIGIVVWKFIAKDAIRFVIGFLFLVIGSSVAIYIIRRNMPGKRKSQEVFEDGKKKTVKYEYGSGDTDCVTGGIITLFLTIIITCLIMFV